MPYDNIPHVGATYLDGSLKQPSGTNQPRILVIGAADSGLTYELFGITNVKQAEVEFGSNTEVLKSVHEAVAQGADNLAIMRIGGKQGTITYIDASGGTLAITPEFRDASILDRYSLIITNDTITNRIVVYDLIDQIVVYDTDEILTINEGIVEVVDTSFGLVAVGDLTDLDNTTSLDDLVVGDFTFVSGADSPLATPTKTAGTDGASMSLPERYAALNTGYHLLDFKDADYVLAPGTFMDSPNISDGVASPDYWKGVPVKDTDCDALGYVWQYIYQGKLYTYMADSATYFSVAGVAAAQTFQTDLVLTAQIVGTGGDKISLLVDTTGGAGPTVVITEPTCDTLLITVTDNGTSDTITTVSAINTALGLYTTTTGVLADTLVVASGGGATVLTPVGSLPLINGAGGAILTHTQLTGDTIPAAVTTRFNAAADTELREINFGHQLASFCRLASKTWKAMQGAIGFLPPPSYDRPAISTWAGSLPTFTQKGTDFVIDTTADNGSGILGNKFLAGLSAAAGYRAEAASEADTNDGFAYGGLIQTKGTALPNGTAWAYGISDTDELIDANGAPVDIGKHLYVTYDWPIHRNTFNGGSPYRGELPATLIGKLVTTPVNQEPIGDNGIITKVTSPPRVHSMQQDGLASLGICGLRREVGLGYIIVSAKTAAHPDSDYSRSSTVRSVNRELDGIRRIGKRYLGKAFNPQSLISLQADIDGFLLAERKAGINSGAQASISFTRADRILGRLDVRLRMVPPFSIELIDVTMSLAADESEL